MLICWSTCQTDPTLSKNKKSITTKLGPTVFFIYYFLLFEKKETKHNTHINNLNQKAFLVIIINYTFSVFLLCLLCKIIFFWKTLTPRIKWYCFYFTYPFTLFFFFFFFFAAFPVNKKSTWFHLMYCFCVRS